MFQPFSKRAQPWEISGRRLRGLLHLREDQILDPYLLAPRVGLTLMHFDDVAVPDDIRHHLLNGASDNWSGGVYATPLPDGTFLCILNPNHDIRRRRITLMEEVSHVFLEHSPTGVRLLGGGLAARDYDEAQEKEAYGVGAAALLPWASFFGDLNRGLSAEEIAIKYGVSVRLVRYRLQITGASNLYRARQSARAQQTAG